MPPASFQPIVLSHYQIHPALIARNRGRTQVAFSFDLGRSEIDTPISTQGIHLPSGDLLNWELAEQIMGAENSCFTFQAGELEKIQRYSPYTQRHYVLYATRRAPTFLNSGIPMHRIKDTDPTTDTQAKIRAAGHLWGNLLDTCTGLGYTAIEAARSAAQVTTMEVDPVVLDIARLNPWSRELFDQPKIKQMLGNIATQIAEFGDGSFSCILHDPPVMNIAGDLYSGEFYRQFYRVLKPNGHLFHYIGDLDSPSGQRVARGATQRLRNAGFTRVVPREEAFGLLAFK